MEPPTGTWCPGCAKAGVFHVDRREVIFKGIELKKLELTDTERFLLANQYEIMGLITKEESYTRLAENLRDGHKWLYEQHTEIAPNLSAGDTDCVLSALDLYDDLHNSYRRIGAPESIKESDVLFPGFDGNNERKLLNFARAVHKSGRYQGTVKDEVPNSHMETREMYGRQIAKWKEIGMPEMPFTHDQICRIVEAREHPSNVA